MLKKLFETKWRVGALLLSLTVAVIYLSTLSSGHAWQYDDFAQYLMHARNIAALKPYAATGYVYNPLNPYTGPQCYPPVFPLLLTPLYKLFGLNLWPMKAMCSLFFAGFIFVLYLFLERRLSPQRAMLCTVAAALNPWFWDFRNTLYSDFPFIFFLLCAVFLLERLEQGDSALPRTKLAMAAAMAAALSLGTRTPALLLLPALLAADYWRHRRFSKAAIFAAGAIAAAYAAQQLFFSGGSGYLAQIKSSVADQVGLPFGARCLLPWTHICIFFSFGAQYSPPLLWCGRILAGLVCALGLAGLYSQLREAPRTGALFALAYGSTFFLGSDGLRYLFPLVPFLLLWSMKGYELAEVRFPAKIIRPVGLALMGMLAFSTAMSYLMLNTGAMKARGKPWDVYSPDAQEMFSFLKKNVPDNSLICARKPRAIALMSGKRAMVYHDAGTDLVAFYDRSGITHVVTASFIAPDLFYITPLIDGHRDRFREVFRNNTFAVYALKDKS